MKSKLLNNVRRIKDEATSNLIKEQDEEKLAAAKELHENIAQELAASRLYLNMAVINEAGRVEYIKEANQSVMH